MPAPRLEEWISLLRPFASGSISGTDFDTKYFTLFRQANEADAGGEPWVDVPSAEMVLADFWAEIDGLSNDPDLFPDLHAREEQLRPAALRIAERLEPLRDHS